MISIRRIDLVKPEELEEALAIVDRVFREFIAPDYSPEGVAEFLDFIRVDPFREKLDSGEREMWLALDDDVVVGLMGLRCENHICLFFVDSTCHHQGVGRALYNAVLEHLRSIGREFVTVYSSPYAVDVYRRMGFTQVSEQTTFHGMVSTPMCAYIFEAV